MDLPFIVVRDDEILVAVHSTMPRIGASHLVKVLEMALDRFAAFIRLMRWAHVEHKSKLLHDAILAPPFSNMHHRSEIGHINGVPKLADSFVGVRVRHGPVWLHAHICQTVILLVVGRHA